MQNKLFHITPERHLDSILKKGIIAGFRKGLTTSRQPKWKTVFLTNNIDRILKDQAGETWSRRHKPIVLEVDIEDLKIEPKKYFGGGTYTISDFEFECKYVPPKKIKIHKEFNEYKKEVWGCI